MKNLVETEKITEEHVTTSVITEAAGGNKGQKQALEVTEEARKGFTLPSFGAKLFTGEFDFSMMYPFPKQTEEDRLIGEKLTDSLMDFLKQNLDPEEVDATRTIPQNVFDGMKKMGIFALKVPKEYGGLGLSQTNYCRLVMKVASYCGGVAVLISAHQSIGVPQPLKLYGTEEQKKKFFPRFREGAISAFALTEPDVGSDPAQMSCTATLSKDGKHYILNGEKLWCTNGPIADIIIVMAKTPPKIVHGKEKQQISAFIVETNTPGLKWAHRCEFMGLGGIYNGLLNLKDVQVPVDNLLGEEGRGLAIALGTINVGRLTLPAASTGVAKQMLSIVRRWGSSRVQWGMPVGLHEAGREKIAYIASTTFAMEAMTWLTCAWADEAKYDIRIEAAMAKLFCTESLWEIVDMTLQLRGGRGYEKARSLKARGEDPFPVERALRDCRINRILEGSSEIMKLLLAREAMDSHLKRISPIISSKTSFANKTASLFKAASHYAVWYPMQCIGACFGGTYSELGRLEKHASFIKKMSHKLARVLFQAMIRYQNKLERKQLLLGRLMEIGTDLFAMAAACSFAVSLKDKQGESPSELADFFCTIARRRILNRFRALDSNDDRGASIVAKKTIEKNYRWLEEGIVWIGKDE